MRSGYYAAHRIGPEYLLGRTDWKDQYLALKNATWKGQLANGVGRVAKAGVNLGDATTSAPATLMSATGLTTVVGALAGGPGAVSEATARLGALATRGGERSGGVAAEHTGRTLSSVAVLPMWTTAANVTNRPSMPYATRRMWWAILFREGCRRACAQAPKPSERVRGRGPITR